MIENESQLDAQPRKPASRTLIWMRRAAVLSFLFFLVKGLVWVGVGVVVAMQVL